MTMDNETSLPKKEKIFSEDMMRHLDFKYAELTAWFDSRKDNLIPIKLVLAHIGLAIILGGLWTLVDRTVVSLSSSIVAIAALPALIIVYVSYIYKYFTAVRLEPIGYFTIYKNLLGSQGVLRQVPKEMVCESSQYMPIINQLFELIKELEETKLQVLVKRSKWDLKIIMILYYLVVIDLLYYVIMRTKLLEYFLST